MTPTRIGELGAKDLLRVTPPSLSDIAAQPFRVSDRISERYVTVRSYEIQRSFPKTGPSHSLLPREYIERKPQLAARTSHTASRFSLSACRFSIYMDLPLQRRQRRKVVFTRSNLHPGQPIPAADSTSSASAQCAVTIVDLSLRYRPEEQPTHCAESKKHRQHERNDARPHEAGENT